MIDDIDLRAGLYVICDNKRRLLGWLDVDVVTGFECFVACNNVNALDLLFVERDCSHVRYW